MLPSDNRKVSAQVPMQLPPQLISYFLWRICTLELEFFRHNFRQVKFLVFQSNFSWLVGDSSERCNYSNGVHYNLIT